MVDGVSGGKFRKKIYLQSSGGNQKKEDCYGKTKNQCFAGIL